MTDSATTTPIHATPALRAPALRPPALPGMPHPPTLRTRPPATKPPAAKPAHGAHPQQPPWPHAAETINGAISQAIDDGDDRNNNQANCQDNNRDADYDEFDATQPGERLSAMMAEQLAACGNAKALGRLGERFAAAHLAEQGWHIVARNYHTRFGELDLICVDEHGQVVFVEVKTRSGMGFGGPREAITANKQRHLRRAASMWMQREPWPRGCRGVRFDLIGVVVHDGVHVDHVKGAF